MYSGLVTNATHTGDATGSGALTVVGARGVALPTLTVGGGLLKYTGTTTNTWVFDTSAYLTGITSGQVTTALGYTPYNSTNPSGYISGNQTITLSGDISGSGATSISTTLATVTQSTGASFVKITLDTKGRVTGNTAVASGDITTVLGYTPYNSTNPSGYISGNQTITLSGDVSGSGATSISATLATITQSTGASFVKITLDTKGRVTGNTAVGSGDITGALGYTPYNSTNPSGYTSNTGTVTSVSGTGSVSGLTLSGSVTTSGSLTLGGTLSLTSGNVTGALGYTPLSSSGSVTIGGNLTVTGAGTSSSIYMSDTDEGQRELHCNSNRIGFLTQAGAWGSYCNDDGSWVSTGDITAFSDERIKENIETIDNALEKTLKLRGVYYNRIDTNDKSRKLGLIAQEIQKVIPEVVHEESDGLLGVSYGNLVGLLIEAFKGLNEKVISQEAQIEELKQRLK